LEDADDPVVEENSVAAGVPPAPAPSLEGGAPPAPADRIARLLNQASEHDRAGRLDAAAGTLAQILAETPEQPAALHMLGIVTFKRGNQIEAARLMERSLAGAPANPLFHRNICEVYRVVGRYDDAVAAGKKAVALATRMALLSKFLDNQVTVLDELAISTPKTKDVVGLLKALGLSGSSCLLTIESHDANVWRSARNIPKLSVSPASDLNAYDLLQRKTILVTKGALDLIRSGKFRALNSKDEAKQAG